VIANSGIYSNALASKVTVKELQEIYNVNTIGPVLLFQASLDLLLKSEKPKFVVVSSTMGSIELAPVFPAPTTAYGSSKAAVNYIVRRIHAENEKLIAFPIHPGWVQTEMGNGGAKAAGLEQAPQTLEESVTGILKEVDEAERGESAKFASYDHTDLPW